MEGSEVQQHKWVCCNGRAHRTMTAPRTCSTVACQLTADFNGSNNLALAFRQKHVDLPRDGGGPAQQNPQAHEQSEPGTIAWARTACALLMLLVFPLARALPVPSAPRPRSWASALRWVGPGAFTFLTTAFYHAPRALYESSPDNQSLALSTPLLSGVPLDLVFFCAVVCTSLAVHASAYCPINPLPSNSYPARRAFLTKHGHYAYSWHHFPHSSPPSSAPPRVEAPLALPGCMPPALDQGASDSRCWHFSSLVWDARKPQLLRSTNCSPRLVLRLEARFLP